MVGQFRNQFTVEMVHQGLDNDTIRNILKAFDTVAVDYSIKPRESNIIPYNYGIPKLLEYYLVSRQVEGLSSKTLQSKKYLLENFFRMVQKDPREIVAIDIRSYMYRYQEENGIDNRTLEWHRSTLMAFFKWACDEEYILRNPCIKIAPIKYEEKEREAITPLELEQLRKGCNTLREKCFLELLYSTGGRISEIIGLTKDKVDIHNETVHVHGKGNKNRSVFLNAKAIIAYSDYMAARGTDDECPYVIACERRNGEGKLHGITRGGAERIIGYIVRNAKAAGYSFSRPITAHVIRHTTAQTLLDHGMPIEQVSAILGHERLETTQIYAKVNNEELKRNHKKYI